MKFGSFWQIEKELRRIGVRRQGDSISHLSVRRNFLTGRVVFKEYPLVWEGTADEALSRLRAVPFLERSKGLWDALPDAHFDEAYFWIEDDSRAEEEVRRVVAPLHRGGGVCWHVGHRPAPGQPCPFRLCEWVVTLVDTYRASGKEVEQWSGTLEDAMERLAALPDGAGLQVFGGRSSLSLPRSHGSSTRRTAVSRGMRSRAS